MRDRIGPDLRIGLEREFGRIIEAFGTPRFGGTHSAAIDRWWQSVYTVTDMWF